MNRRPRPRDRRGAALLLQKPTVSRTHVAFSFTGEYDGNVDVYVVESSGGVPQRLTWHPAEDHVAGWTPDGKAVLFRSRRASFHYFDRLFTVPLSGGLPQELPLPRAVQGTFSADGKRLAQATPSRARAARSPSRRPSTARRS